MCVILCVYFIFLVMRWKKRLIYICIFALYRRNIELVLCLDAKVLSPHKIFGPLCDR